MIARDVRQNTSGKIRRPTKQAPRAGIVSIRRGKPPLLPGKNPGARNTGAGPALEFQTEIGMANVVPKSSAASTSASAASASATASATIGQSIDKEITLLRARVAALESTAKTDWTDVKSWVKTNWAHFVTWAALAASSPVVTDIVKKII